MGLVILCPEEKETVIQFDQSSDVCQIYTTDRTSMTKLDRLVLKCPNTYKLVKSDEISKTYETKKKMISFRSPKIMSEENKEKARQRASEMGKARKGNNAE